MAWTDPPPLNWYSEYGFWPEEDHGWDGRYISPRRSSPLRQVDVLTAQGTPVEEAGRSIGVTEVTSYLYGGLSHCKSILN